MQRNSVEALLSVLGRTNNLCCQSDLLERPNAYPGEIEFPPGNTVTRGLGHGVVVVVPAFAEREHGYVPDVPAVFPRVVKAVSGSLQVTNRIDHLSSDKYREGSGHISQQRHPAESEEQSHTSDNVNTEAKHRLIGFVL